MSYRMKSMVLFALILMALPVAAFAQTSRLEGMALQGDYVKDYTSIYTYPSQVPNVGNLAYAEMGNTGGFGGLLNPGNTVAQRAFGSVLGNLFDGRFGAFALHLHQVTPPLGLGSDPSLDTNRDPNTNNHEQYDIMWGKKFGTMSLGARINSSKYEDITSPVAPGTQTTFAFDPAAVSANQGRNIFGFGAGVTFEMNPNSTVDVGLLYQSRTFEQTFNPIGANTNSSEDSPTSYMLSGRLMWQYQSNLMITPVFKYYSYDLSRKTIAATSTTFNNTIKGWQLGAAANWSLGSNDMLVWGLDFIQNKVEQDDALFGLPQIGFPATADVDLTETMFPRLFAALETHVNPWLTLRMGASKGVFSKLKVEPQTPGTQREVTLSDFSMNIGAGVKLGTVQLDAVLADNAFNYANGLLGGVTPDGGFFPKVTATYSF